MNKLLSSHLQHTIHNNYLPMAPNPSTPNKGKTGYGKIMHNFESQLWIPPRNKEPNAMITVHQVNPKRKKGERKTISLEVLYHKLNPWKIIINKNTHNSPFSVTFLWELPKKTEKQEKNTTTHQDYKIQLHDNTKKKNQWKRQKEVESRPL